MSFNQRNDLVMSKFEFVKSIGAMLRSFWSALLAGHGGNKKDPIVQLDGARPPPGLLFKQKYCSDQELLLPLLTFLQA
jgi:hypothetical protein